MAGDLNRCEFIGRLGNPPESRYMPSGDAVVTFSIAVGEKWKDKQGQAQERTEWVRVTAFRKLGEICAQYLDKGSQVYIAGKFRTDKFEKDGVTRYSTSILLDDMQMLGGRPDGAQGRPSQASGRSYDQASNGSSAQQPQRPSERDFDDDIPF